MTADNVSFERLRFIELRGDGSKLPAKKWGGYSQDFDEAEHVHTHDDIVDSDASNWGIVDVEDPPHGSTALLIFDIDVHKAPEQFDANRVGVPNDTLVTRSQNGGFHVYFIVTGYGRGDLNESDFQMMDDPGFDVDIRGSAVSHHVVAPADIPGVGGDYSVINDEAITAYFDPGQAARRITLDGSPLLEFDPEGGVEGYDFEVPDEPPEDMPTCYHAGLELRKASPDDHPNTHKVNVLTASCGLAAGFDPEEVAGHFVGEYAPTDSGVDVSDKEKTEYQVRHLSDGGYAPPSEQTLRDYGILSEGEHCDEDCPIEYHGPYDDEAPELDVVAEMTTGEEAVAEAEEVAGSAETDGGAVAAPSGPETGPSTFEKDVQSIFEEYRDDEIRAKTVRHRIAKLLSREYHFLYPEREVRGWREALYVYNSEEGIYEPRGEVFIKSKLERIAGDFITNTVANEIVEKVKRRNIERGAQFEVSPERLVVGNGILDLHTGDLSPYSPTEYHRTKLNVDWNPDAGEPAAIDDFLHDIVDDSDVSTLYRLIAHTLYKEYVGEKAAMLIGSGQNGKSVFLDFIEKFLGDYNVSHRALQEFEDQFAANQLEGKLANIHPDMGDSTVKDLSTFKKLTGRDQFTADVKYESPITFENYATLLFAANEMPVFGEDNHAVWRRWVYVDFPYEFRADKPDAKDPEPKSKIMRRLTQDEEMEALLLRAQQEIERWHDGGEWFADAMRPEEVREKMKKAAEPIYAFATTCLETGGGDDDDVFVRKSLVREAYSAYANEEDLPRVPENQFGERLMKIRDYHIESGQRRVNGTRTHVYNNVQLSPRGRQLLGIDEPDEGQSQVDDSEPPKKVIMERVREMVEENDGEPVPKSGVVWSVSKQMTRTRAEQEIESLCERGDLMETGSGDEVIST